MPSDLQTVAESALLSGAYKFVIAKSKDTRMTRIVGANGDDVDTARQVAVLKYYAYFGILSETDEAKSIACYVPELSDQTSIRPPKPDPDNPPITPEVGKKYWIVYQSLKDDKPFLYQGAPIAIGPGYTIWKYWDVRAPTAVLYIGCDGTVDNAVKVRAEIPDDAAVGRIFAVVILSLIMVAIFFFYCNL